MLYYTGVSNMELCKEILAHFLACEDARILFPSLQLNSQQIVEMQCYRVLRKIKAIIEDESLDDPECFHKIEEIIAALEEIGSNGGFRHDF